MKKFVALFAAVLLVALWGGVALAAGDGDSSPTPRELGITNLKAQVTMNASYSRTWQWAIKKTVTPCTWDIFAGDEAVSTYTVCVTKTGCKQSGSISGIVKLINSGHDTTQNLAISLKLEADSGSGPVLVSEMPVDISAMPVLGASVSDEIPTTFDYSYTFANFVPVAGVNYTVTATITTTNDYFHDNGIFTASTSGQATGNESNSTIHVTDTWAGAGSPWEFTDSGSVSYPRTFTADESGEINNTATIKETNQSASAKVTITRRSLNIAKTAAGTFSRKYIWTLDKSGDQTALKLGVNQTAAVNYTVTVKATPTDSDFAAGGTITVANPASIDAVINSVADIATGDIAGVIDTTGITFPYVLKGGATLTLKYTMALPDASARTNTATAVQQNHRWYKDTDGIIKKTPISGTKSFTANANIAFGQPSTVIDGSACVTDSLFGSLGTVQATATPAVFRYTLKFTLTCASGGGYTVAVSKKLPVSPLRKCTETSWKMTNTATLKTCTTKTVLTDSWTVTITKGTSVGTYTIGYWKTHTCELSKRLPIWLGTQGGCKSVQVKTATDAVKYLGMSVGSSSNGIVKLYAQLLAAKLNIKNGADPSAVSSVVSSADAFLAKNNVSSWTGLSASAKNQVLSWATTLDNYNNGVIGPGHAG